VRAALVLSRVACVSWVSLPLQTITKMGCEPKNGLHASFIRAVGRGEREPLIPTPDEQAEPRNRRVEVIVR